jgi:hypothetical protein
MAYAPGPDYEEEEEIYLLLNLLPMDISLHNT